MATRPAPSSQAAASRSVAAASTLDKSTSYRSPSASPLDEGHVSKVARKVDALLKKLKPTAPSVDLRAVRTELAKGARQEPDQSCPECIRSC